MSWFVLERTGSTVAVGALWVLITAPGLVVPAVGGVVIDRSDRRRLHVALDLVRGALVLLAAALVRDASLALPAVYALLLLLGIGWAVSFPTLSALVQELTPQDRLVRANAAFQVSVQAGMMSAGAVVGFAYAAMGLPGILLVDGVTYLVSAGCLALLRSGARPPAPGDAAVTFVHEVREGLTYLRAHPPVRALGAAWACMMGGVLSGTVLIVALARDVLHAGARGYGYLESGWAAGAVLGGLLAGRLVRHGVARVLPVFMLAGLALGHGVLPLLTVLAVAVAAQVLFGTFRALGGVAIQSALMAAVPPRLMGRVQSAFSMLSTVLQVVMSLLLGWMAQAVSLQAAFVAVGSLYGAAAVSAARARLLSAATMPPSR